MRGGAPGGPPRSGGGRIIRGGNPGGGPVACKYSNSNEKPLENIKVALHESQVNVLTTTDYRAIPCTKFVLFPVTQNKAYVGVCLAHGAH